MKSFKLLILFTLLANSLGSCIIKESSPDKFVFTVTVNSIEAITSCENDGVTGEADIYTNLKLLTSTAANINNPTIVASIPDVIIGLRKGEKNTNPGISVEAEISSVNGLRFFHELQTSEIDAGGAVEVTQKFVGLVFYDLDQECFVENGLTSCGITSLEDSNTYLNTYSLRVSNGFCIYDIDWTMSIRPI